MPDTRSRAPSEAALLLISDDCHLTPAHTHTHTQRLELLKFIKFFYNLYKAIKVRTRCLGMCVCTYGCVSALYIQYMPVTLLPLLHIFLSSIIFISSSFRVLLSLNHFRLRADLQN